MRSIFKNKAAFMVAFGSGIGMVGLIAGCGGGGGGSSKPSGTPSPFDSSAYTATYTPNVAVPSDAKAPTGTLNITNGRGTGVFTFYLQQKVIDGYQPIVDKALSDNGVGSDIRNNQIPTSIPFNFSRSLDGSGKVIFTSSNLVKVCGTGTLTVDSTFLATGGGSGNYKLTFPNSFTVSIRGKNRTITVPNGNGLYCNNLPLREGTVVFNRPTPTNTPITTGTPAVG